jgi:hypothetical protein
MKKWFSWEKVTGRPVMSGRTRVTPESLRITLGHPDRASKGRGGGFIHHRPLAVLVEQDGSQQRLPIVDLTLLLQILMVAVGILTVYTIKRKIKRSMADE